MLGDDKKCNNHCKDLYEWHIHILYLDRLLRPLSGRIDVDRRLACTIDTSTITPGGGSSDEDEPPPPSPVASTISSMDINAIKARKGRNLSRIFIVGRMYSGEGDAGVFR